MRDNPDSSRVLFRQRQQLQVRVFTEGKLARALCAFLSEPVFCEKTLTANFLTF